ncbi:MAG: amidohydrolase family protein [Hyphomonadaceae bacterium]
MKLDLFLKDGLIVTPDQGVAPGSVGVKDGKIAVLAAPGERFDAARTIECKGRWIMPGVIDPHVHFGFGSPETDFHTESRSAALGGVTFVISFYRTKDFRDGFDGQREKAEGQSLIDFSFHLGLTSDLHVRTLAECYERFGVSSYKMYLMYKGQAGLSKGFTEIDDGLLYAAMVETAKLPGAVLGVHCENVEVIPYLREPLRAAGRSDLGAWDDQSPDFLEAENVHRTCYFAAKTGAAVNIVHLSSREALEEVRRHRNARKAPIYVETCPHYLHLTRDAETGVLAKVNPPLRSAGDIDAMWEGVLDGSVTTIASDHVPRKRETKKEIWSSTNGFPGTGMILPVLIHAGYHERGVPIEKLAAVMSKNAARIYNTPSKGGLMIGQDADIAIVDPDESRMVDAAKLGSFADYSPWEGQALKGWPSHTISRGRVVVEDGALSADAQEGAGGKYYSRKPETRT